MRPSPKPAYLFALVAGNLHRHAGTFTTRSGREVALEIWVEPQNADLFTWWAPWRNLRQRNIGWRLDMVLASAALADKTVSCVVQREFGTSDHGAVIATFDV